MISSQSQQDVEDFRPFAQVEGRYDADVQGGYSVAPCLVADTCLQLQLIAARCQVAECQAVAPRYGVPRVVQPLQPVGIFHIVLQGEVGDGERHVERVLPVPQLHVLPVADGQCPVFLTAVERADDLQTCDDG